MLTNKEIKHIAQLARIKLTDKEEEKFSKELSSILDYIDQLNQVKIDGVEPLYQPSGMTDVLRKDEHIKDFVMDEELNEKLIGQAPYHENRFVKVKSVLKR